jgi:CheY-like chemotaxis protein
LEAEDGSQALALCAAPERCIQLLVTDLAMPHMSGLELVERLGRLVPGVKALCISGYLDEADLEQPRSQADGERLASGVAFLPKPFSPDSLARRVRQVLDGEAEMSRTGVHDRE